MPCCPRPWTMSTLSGGSRSQRPQNQGSLQGTPQQVLGNGAEAGTPDLVGQALGPDPGTSLPTLLPAFQGKDPAAFSHLEDPRQCALCLKYGDADSKVRATL